MEITLMAGLKWIVVGVSSLVGGYFGYLLTGGWMGVPIAAAAMAFASSKLFGGEVLSAFMALCVGAGAIFQFIGGGAFYLRRCSGLFDSIAL